uniref:hypothetical protein n=1 Tax=Eubacterium cellulosolvens TaxID=29322 RepID=UPI00138B1678|nr:hypothetical protein [[Eubacterium] cellulosolvens]
MKTGHGIDRPDCEQCVFAKKQWGNRQQNGKREDISLSGFGNQESEKRHREGEGAEKQKGAGSSPDEKKCIREKKQSLSGSCLLSFKALIDERKERQCSNEEYIRRE